MIILNIYISSILTISVPSPCVTVSVCKQFEFVIRSVNNVKTARQKIVNQSENEYG